MTAKKVLPLTGILAVVLVIVAFVVGGETPDTDDSVQKVASFYTENDSDQEFAGALLAWAAIAFLFFAGALWHALRRAEGEGGVFSTISFAGAVVFAVGLAIFAGISLALGAGAEHMDPSGIQTLHVLNNEFFFPAAVGVATFYLSTGIAVIKTGVLPKWLGWVTLVLGVIAITPAGFVSFLAIGLWILIVSVLLFMRADSETTAAPPPSAPQPPVV